MNHGKPLPIAPSTYALSPSKHSIECPIFPGTGAARPRYRRMRSLLVHNPTAGTKGHDKGSIVDALHLADYEAVYVSTKEHDVKGALQEHYDLVVVAGGDGTVSYVFCHLADRSIPIGVMPFGSANNIARSLGIAGTPAELAERWRTGRPQQFHLMNVTEDSGKREVSVEGFGVGLIPALIKRRAKGKKADGADDIRRGRRALGKILYEIEPLDIEINIDGKLWKSDLISVDVLNIPFTGPALPLAHAADPTDKLLDVVVLEGDQRRRFAEWIRAPQETASPVSPRAAARRFTCAGAGPTADSTTRSSRANRNGERLR